MAGDGPVRWGLLGTGGITAKLIVGARESSQVELVAVGSRTAERADAFAAQTGIERAHGSYDALLADPLVEAVYISLPNSLHHQWTMRALAAGKHVLCEKPYSRRPSDVVEAFDAADAAGMILSEAFMWRHHPQVATLHSLLPEIGRLQTIRATFSFVLEEEVNIRLSPELDGGSLMDVGCYCVSGARLVAGEEPDVVYGIGVAGPSGVDTRFHGSLHFPSGVVAQFMSAFTTDHRGLEVIGSDGSFLLTDPWQSQPATLIRNGTETAFEPANPYHLELDDLSSAIRHERPPRLGRDDALGQARTIEALLRSAETGDAVHLT